MKQKRELNKPEVVKFIEITSREQLKYEVMKFMDDLKQRNFIVFNRKVFKCYRPSLYKDIFAFTSFLDEQCSDFCTRLHCILEDIVEIPRCKTCGKELKAYQWKLSHNIPQYCSNKCVGKSEEIKERNQIRRQNMTLEEKNARHNKLCEIQRQWNAIPGNKERKVAKTRQTKKERYGSETYVNVEKSKQTKLEKYGDSNYTNKEKAKQTNAKKTIEQKQKEIDKRLATYNKHKAEDPDFVKRKQEKSIATRKRNHGEDYTGRKKCWNTIKDRYGVSNPMNIKEVKDHMKQHNLETYGVEWHIAAPEIREKSRQTFQENYGVDNPFASKEIIEQIKQHNLENYGVEYNWQREDVKQHIKETNKRLYGYESAMQNPEIRSKMMSNIKYDGKSFDSYPELCFYVWLVDNNISFEFQPKTPFEYEFDGKLHTYCPDFKVGDMYFEIKGDHFFKDGKMICPFRYSNWDDQRYAYECDRYEAKHQCMIQNNVIILQSNEYVMFVEYVNEKMGKDFYKSLKDKKMST